MGVAGQTQRQTLVVEDGVQGLRDFHRRWRTLQPPLRPHTDVVASVEALLPADPRPVLLLGVTPELAAIGRRMLALDWSERMRALAWPGDDERRRALLADWKALPIAREAACAAIGDGSLTMLRYPLETGRVLDQLAAVLAGGRAIIRCFATPEPAESIEAVRAAALAGGLGFHAFKLRFNMAVAREDGGVNVTSDRLFERFEALFPDRAALSRASGWSPATIAEMDAYRGSPYVHSYPSRSELLAVASAPGRGIRFAPSGGYPLAERCPLMVIDFA